MGRPSVYWAMACLEPSDDAVICPARTGYPAEKQTHSHGDLDRVLAFQCIRGMRSLSCSIQESKYLLLLGV